MPRIEDAIVGPGSSDSTEQVRCSIVPYRLHFALNDE